MNESIEEPSLAYIALQVQRGRSNEVVDDVRALAGVTYAGYAVGTLDVLAKIEAKDIRSLIRLITQIGRSPGVLKTTTYLVVEGGKSKEREKQVGGIMFATAYTTANYSQLVERLAQHDSVNCVSLVLGEYDLIVEIVGKTLPEIRNAIRSIQEKEKEIVSTNTVPVLE